MFWVPLGQTGGRSWLHTVHDEKIYLENKTGSIHNLLTLKNNVNDFCTEELSLQQCTKYQVPWYEQLKTKMFSPSPLEILLSVII